MLKAQLTGTVKTKQVAALVPEGATTTVVELIAVIVALVVTVVVAAAVTNLARELKDDADVAQGDEGQGHHADTGGGHDEVHQHVRCQSGHTPHTVQVTAYHRQVTRNLYYQHVTVML